MNKNTRSLCVLFVFLAGLAVSAHAAPLPSAAQNLESLIKKVFPSVVRVEARDGWRKVATGVVIDKDGYIVTTALISPRDAHLFVISSEGEEVEAEFLGMDPETHLALIKAKDKKWKPIEMGRMENLSPGSDIAVVCFSPEEKAAITKGIVSSVGRDSLRLNVVVIPGASGSPVIDMQGRMIGLVRGAYVGEIGLSVDGRQVSSGNIMMSRMEGPSSGIASAIPLDIVDKVSTEIRETGKVRRGWLGVSFILNDNDEIEIVTVEAESPAEDAGLEEGDILHEIDGQEIVDQEMLYREIRMHTPGDEVDLRIERQGKEQKVEVELGEYSQQAIARELGFKFPELFQVRPGETPEIFRAAPGRFLNWISEDRKYIGVQIQQLNPELAEFFGVEDGAGLLISSVEEDTPAQKAGLRVGDVIVRADGKETKNSDRLTRLLQGLEEGDKVKLEIVRDKKTRTVEVEVAVEKSARRRFVPEDTGQTQARSYQRFQDAFEAQHSMSDEAARRHTEALKLYQENLNRRSERLEKEFIKESLKRKAEVRRNYEEYRKQAFEQQKKATDRLKIALERYRCIKV